MSRRIRTILILLPFALSGLAAQETAGTQPITLSGQLRARTEFDDKGLTQDESTLTHLLRTRFRATARPIEGVTVVVELQDGRFFGSGDPAQGRGTMDATAEGLDLHLAFAQIERVLGSAIDLRLGRQELAFNNERLVGSLSWANSSRAFDAARATLRSDQLNIDLVGSRLSAPTASPTASQNLYGIWGTYTPAKTLQAELYGLRDDNTAEIIAGADSGESLLARYTAGLYVKGSVDIIDFELEGIGQTGTTSSSDTTPRRDIRAFLGSAVVGVTIMEEDRTRVQGLITVLSGDGSSGDTINETFNTLFGTNHKFYGVMDYFPALSGSLGLVDMSAGVATTLTKGLRVALDGHLFGPQRGGGGENFGTEIDLQFWWRGVNRFELSGGASTFLPGELAKPRLGEDPRFWVWIAGQWEI